MDEDSIVMSLKHNGANNGSRDSNLNHYKLNQVYEKAYNICNHNYSYVFIFN